MTPAILPAQTSVTPTLASLRDYARPLLVFAPSAQDPRLLQQTEALTSHAAEARDRDLVGIAVPAAGDPGPAVHLSAPEAAAARRRFHVGPQEFAVVLVGKDGGEKLRSRQPFRFETLRETIDAMPMRQDEMRARPK